MCFNAWIQILRNKKKCPYLKQTWKFVGFLRDVEREMSQARTALAQFLPVIGCHIDLANRRQHFACQELGRLLGRNICEELKNNLRN